MTKEELAHYKRKAQHEAAIVTRMLQPQQRRAIQQIAARARKFHAKMIA